MGSEAQQSGKPSFCDLIITERCMLRCKMCHMWQSGPGAGEVGVSGWKAFIDSLADFVDGRAQIQFVGGEPLLKDGALEMIRHAADRGFSTTMTTNAYLINEELAGKIIGSGLHTLVFSLDSMDAKTHDSLRGREGVHRNAMQAIELFGRNKNWAPRIHIVATIMKPNLYDLHELVEWSSRCAVIDGISFQAVAQPFFTPADNLWYKSSGFSFLWPEDVAEVDRVMDALIAQKRNGRKIINQPAQLNAFRDYFRNPERFVRATRCHLGYDALSVNTQGNIFLCLSLEPIGRIQDGIPLRELWFSQQAHKVRQKIKDCQRNCKLMLNCFFEEESPAQLQG